MLRAHDGNSTNRSHIILCSSSKQGYNLQLLSVEPIAVFALENLLYFNIIFFYIVLVGETSIVCSLLPSTSLTICLSLDPYSALKNTESKPIQSQVYFRCKFVSSTTDLFRIPSKRLIHYISCPIYVQLRLLYIILVTVLVLCLSSLY